MHVDVACRHARNAGSVAEFFERHQPEVVVELVQQFDGDPEMDAEHRLRFGEVGAEREAVDRAAGPALRHEEDFAMRERRGAAVFPADAIFAFWRLGRARRGDEFAQISPAFEVVRDRHQPETPEIELAAEQQPEIRVARERRRLGIGKLPVRHRFRMLPQGDMRPHDARDRTFVRDRQRAVAQLIGLRDQLPRPRRTALEAEIGEAVQFRIRRKFGRQAGRQRALRHHMKLDGTARPDLLVGEFRHRSPGGTIEGFRGTPRPVRPPGFLR